MKRSSWAGSSTDCSRPIVRPAPNVSCDLLEPRCAEIVANKPRDEREVMNLACLVDRDRLKDFETGVVEAARGFNNDFAFDFNGPWPPHNFVEVELRLS